MATVATSLAPPPGRTAQDIRSLRAASGLTQEAFGAFLGLSRGTVHRLETGERIPTKVELWALQAVEEQLSRESIDARRVYIQKVEAFKASIRGAKRLYARTGDPKHARMWANLERRLAEIL